jgi:hypothetical protein
MHGDVVRAVFSYTAEEVRAAAWLDVESPSRPCSELVLPNGESPTRRHPLSANRGSSPSSRSFRDSILTQPITTVRF